MNENLSMFYNASPLIFERAKELRNNMTHAESLLWEQLKGKQVLNLKFRPQHPIGQFIADFYCHSLKLVIEIDGGIHQEVEQMEYDINRKDELENFGIKLIRFTNNEIETDIPIVIRNIEDECYNRIVELNND